MNLALIESDFLPRWSDPLSLLNPVRNEHGQRQVDKLVRLYERNCLAKVAEKDNYLIPRKIHRIWLGSKEPTELYRLGETWNKAHPEWEYTLWDDNKVKQFDFGTRDLFEQANCFGQKADILRVEILKVHGGLYVDCDFECIEKVDTFLKRYEFFASSALVLQAHLGWPEIWKSPLIVNNALIGSRPDHPILHAYLNRIRANWQGSGAYEIKTGELSPIALWAMGGRKKAHKIKELGLRTYLPFHDSVVEEAGLEGRLDVVFPHTFFHPSLGGGISPLLVMPQFWSRAQGLATFRKLKDYDRLWPHSFANHLSKRTWAN